MPILIIALLMAVAGASADEPARLQLKPQVTVEADTVCLRDVVEPVQAAPDSLQRMLSTPLATLPPGTTRTLSQGHIRLLIRRAGLDPSGVALAGADRACITRTGPARSPSTASAPAATRPVSSSQSGPSVPRGSRVRVRVRIGSLSVEADGELVEPGRIGEIAKLRIQDTRAVVRGLLVASSVAEVVL
ncbi:MAG: hypothetical protein HPY44_02505 [Armatimonadetes bacterium]|nr:hypothetical protein [Armatimonadota bacterium]